MRVRSLRIALTVVLLATLAGASPLSIHGPKRIILGVGSDASRGTLARLSLCALGGSA
jgi:hypothetical protein